jgi:hypothetical protein
MLTFSFAPMIDPLPTTQFEQPSKCNNHGSVVSTSSISSHVIHDDFDMDDDSYHDEEIS